MFANWTLDTDTLCKSSQKALSTSRLTVVKCKLHIIGTLDRQSIEAVSPEAANREHSQTNVVARASSALLVV